MPSIGRVTKKNDGSYEGYLSTLSIRENIIFHPNKKPNDNQPDLIIKVSQVEIGAAWNKTGKSSGKDYVSVSLATPEFGNQTIFANFGQEAGQGDEDVFALIWNPVT
jgi:uncharacterized protein (DUF736 family)